MGVTKLPAQSEAPMIDLFVPCLPVAQPRQRHRLVSSGTRQFTMNYTPAKHPVNEFKATVRLATAQVMAKYLGVPTEPMRVEALFIFPRPGNMRWKTREMPRAPHAKKPDVENVAKALLDALSGLVWVDDAQVCELCVSKVIAAGDEQPGVQLKIDTLCAATIHPRVETP